ncbi:hypothetical protein [Fodinibius sp.]|uniref:hypothetical protein n=1 Tax=Fodinibius sp. TaxID=1872440 RepID=UPI002ACED683|nr:hypothetical protein [Fodinibius sp.]MDZ7658080.1 hypothetical protein [Fodinibius sp.]
MSEATSTHTPDWERILRFVEIIIVLGTLIWTAAFLRSDINNNTKWNKRQDNQIDTYQERVRGTYVRQDVAQQRYKNLIDKLEMIDKKLD